MTWFDNIRIAPKLIGGFMAVALLAGLGGAAAARAAHGMAGGGLVLGGTLALMVLLAAVGGALLARTLTRPLAAVHRACESASRICLTHLSNGMTAFSKGCVSSESPMGAAAATPAHEKHAAAVVG